MFPRNIYIIRVKEWKLKSSERFDFLWGASLFVLLFFFSRLLPLPPSSNRKNRFWRPWGIRGTCWIPLVPCVPAMEPIRCQTVFAFSRATVLLGARDCRMQGNGIQDSFQESAWVNIMDLFVDSPCLEQSKMSPGSFLTVSRLLSTPNYAAVQPAVVLVKTSSLQEHHGHGIFVIQDSFCIIFSRTATRKSLIDPWQSGLAV